ncbi:MAG: response regulator transcription factor [Bacteroidetes bacterium]|nr:response regulator transcription factor [Bacteroidota bacterium]
MNILIVDDNKEFREAFKFMFEENLADQYEQLYEAENGEQCLEVISKESVDIVFMDKQMPVMDGVAATKKIVDQYRHIKVIAVSFHSELDDIKVMLEAGARNYIVKEEISPNAVLKCL